VNLSDSELWNVYLPPFAAAVRAGAGSVMAAYTPLNGVPAAANRWLLEDVLRRQWNFQGFVVSDSESVKHLVTQGLAADARDAAARALNAGLDMEMAYAQRPGDTAFSQLPQALAAGLVSQRQLDDAVRRVLMTKARLGLFDNPYVDPERARNLQRDPGSRALARQAAERGAVLLKNAAPGAAATAAAATAKPLLPLAADRLHAIAVLGPLADSRRDTLGPWVFQGANRDDAVTVLAGIRARAGVGVRVDYAPGVQIPERTFGSPFDALLPPEPRPAAFDAHAEFERALALARRADVAVLVLGESQNQVGENASRSTLAFAGDQQRLLEAVVATGKPVVLLVMSARPLDLRWAEAHVPAILMLWYPGVEGGAAAASLLFGDAVPGGKLPYNWPRDVGQIPMPYAQLLSQAPESAGQRYWNEASTPLYPFGYGLSYASFSFSNPRVDRARINVGDTVTASIDVRNTGAMRATETVQLYLHQRFGSSARPRRELKGFQRIALAPGETRTVQFRLGPDELRYWSAARREWVLEPSLFDIWLGGDANAAASVRFEVVSAPVRQGRDAFRPPERHGRRFDAGGLVNEAGR